MTELLAHAGAGEGGLAAWQLVLVAGLYLTLGTGLGVGMLLGRRAQQAEHPPHRAPVRDFRPRPDS